MLIQNTHHFIYTLGSLVLPSLILLVIIIFCRGKIKKGVLKQDERFFIPVIIASLYFIFFMLLGYYADRLTFSLVPFIIYYCGYFLNDYKLSTTEKTFLIALILLQYMYVAIFDPPHFSTIEFYN